MNVIEDCQEKIENIIEYYSGEHMLSLAELVGILEIVKNELLFSEMESD